MAIVSVTTAWNIFLIEFYISFIVCLMASQAYTYTTKQNHLTFKQN